MKLFKYTVLYNIFFLLFSYFVTLFITDLSLYNLTKSEKIDILSREKLLKTLTISLLAIIGYSLWNSRSS